VGSGTGDDVSAPLQTAPTPVFCFDDMLLASQVWPALTTIRQPINAMSAKAAELLLRQLRGEADDQAEHIIESSVTFRQSTAPAHNQKLERVRSARRAKAALASAANDE
jgi:hypothetical protein